MLTETLFESNSIALNVARGPRNGPPLVMFHGVTRRWQTFVPLLPALLPRWQVFAIDFRGHGRSPTANSAYRVVDYVDDAVAVLSEFLPEPAVVYGHSLGSMVAAAVAGRVPERVAAVILEDPPFGTMGARLRHSILQSLFAGMQTLAGDKRPISEIADVLGRINLLDPATKSTVPLRETRDAAALRFTASCLAQLDPQVLACITDGHWLDGYDIETVLGKVACPTLLLQADPAQGGMLIDTDAEHAAATIADCSHVRFPGVGHLIHTLRTDALVSVLLNFLESLDIRINDSSADVPPQWNRQHEKATWYYGD